MKSITTLIVFFLSFFSFSQAKSECDTPSMPYWARGINSGIEGEVPALERAFNEIRLHEKNIEPPNGFITLRIHLSKNNQICDIETFQIDDHYKNTVFNNGRLIKKLVQITYRLSEWKGDKNHKTYNLIRLKIIDGRIEEIF